MSYASLLNHTVSVWRSTESTGTLGAVVRTWAVVATGLAAAIQVQEERWESAGPGEMTHGKYKGFLDVDADVEEGDVVEVTAGPGTFGFLKVHRVYRPRGHHTELTLSDTREAVA